MHKGFAAWAARWRVPLGFAWGAAYLIFSQPTLKLIAGGGGIALVGVLIRSFSAGFLEKDTNLATHGPYCFTRNPLYLGSFFIGLGFSIAGGSWPLAASFLVLFLIVYLAVMKREAQSLHQRFGEAYERYARAVPLFIPGFKSYQQEPGPKKNFQWSLYCRNHEHEAALGYLAGLVFLAAKMWLR